VLAGGQDWGGATTKAKVALESVVRSIRVLVLEVAARKTEVVIFHGRSRGPPPPILI